MIAAIDTEALLELLWVGPVASTVVAATFALCVYGAAKAGDHRRAGQAGAATAYAGLSVLGGLAGLAVCVLGISIIIAG